MVVGNDFDGRLSRDDHVYMVDRLRQAGVRSEYDKTWVSLEFVIEVAVSALLIILYELCLLLLEW